jgi:hypothetical protein
MLLYEITAKLPADYGSVPGIKLHDHLLNSEVA